MKQTRKRKAVAVIIAILLVLAPITLYAATTNSVDRVPVVRVDHEFTGSAAPTLYIEETRAEEFRGEPQRIRLILQNAEWIERDAIANDTETGGGAVGVDNLLFFSDTILQITLVPEEESDDPGWWRIPLYTEITGGAYASVRIDPLGARVTAGTYPFAEVLDGRPGEVDVRLITPGNRPVTVEPGDVIDDDADVFIEFKESHANTISSVDTVFQLKLENGEWFPNSRTQLNADRMERNADIDGDHEVQLRDVRRVNAELLEVTFRSQGFSDEPAVITMPLYFEVTEYGEVTLEVSLKDSRDPSVDVVVAVSEEPEPEPEPEPVEASFTVGQLGYRLDGQLVVSDVAPYIQPTTDSLGRIMVPVRFVSDATGADEVIWDPINRKVFVFKGDTEIEMTIGNNILLVDGVPRVMDAVAEIQDIGGGLGRTMLPVAHLARALDVDYEWNAATRTVTFYVQ